MKKEFNKNETMEKINEIHNILAMAKPYGRIKDLTDLMHSVRTVHSMILSQKKSEVLDLITRCMGDIHTLAGSGGRAKEAVTRADNELVEQKKRVAEAKKLTVLDAMITRLLNYKDSICKHIEIIIKTPERVEGGAPPKQLKIAQVRRYDVFPVRRIETPEEVDAYLDSLRKKLLDILKDNDGIQIN